MHILPSAENPWQALVTRAQKEIIGLSRMRVENLSCEMTLTPPRLDAWMMIYIESTRDGLREYGGFNAQLHC